MANLIRPTCSVLLATLIVIGVTLVGPALALPQQPATSQQAAAFQAPPDVKTPPADAEKSKTGLASKVIKPGTGTTHPTTADRVTVHYTGWTTDGKMFDSSHRAEQAEHVPARPRDPGLDRGRAAHGRRREAPLVDSRGAGLQGRRRPAAGHAGVRRRAARHHAGPADPARRGGAARRRAKTPSPASPTR